MAALGLTHGQVSELTVVARIRPGQVDSLRETLRALDERAIFRAIRTVHFARWVILAPDGDAGDAHLLFTCNYDGPLDAYLADLAAGLPEELSAAWGNCDDWPGSAALPDWTAFVQRHAITASAFYAAYPDASVQDVARGLKVDSAVQDLLDALQSRDG